MESPWPSRHPAPSPSRAGFIGPCNLLDGRVDEAPAEGSTARVELGSTGHYLKAVRADGVREGPGATVGLRSERIPLTDRADVAHDDVNVLRAKIKQCSCTGARFEYHLTIGGLDIRAESPVRHTGQEINLLTRRQPGPKLPRPGGRFRGGASKASHPSSWNRRSTTDEVTSTRREFGALAMAPPRLSRPDRPGHGRCFGAEMLAQPARQGGGVPAGQQTERPARFAVDGGSPVMPSAAVRPEHPVASR
jgi:hypothetical protein